MMQKCARDRGKDKNGHEEEQVKWGHEDLTSIQEKSSGVQGG
jgi:hypothetical protein